MVSGKQDLVFTGAIPTQARRSEIPRSCVPDIDVMDLQALDPVDMDDKCVNPHEAVKEALKDGRSSSESHAIDWGDCT